jgi:hypothetical protein
MTRFALLLVSLATAAFDRTWAFYLPGVNPRSFAEGEQ